MATFIPADIITKDGIEIIAESTLKALGRLDLLVNSAGATRASYVTGHNHYIGGGWGELTLDS